VLRDLRGEIRRGAVIAALAPGDEPHLSGERLSKVNGADSPWPRLLGIFGQCPCPN
jgi:hypothetical protein